MEHLLENWSQLKEIFSQEEILLLLDYDGTLTPIVEKPQLATLSSEMRELLKRLGKIYTLAIVSGRALSDVKNLVKVSGIYYAGNHGLEISNDIELRNPEIEKFKPVIQEICEKLERKVEDIEGALVENKGLTASLHYRLVAEEEIEELKKIFKQEVRHYISEEKIKVTTGKKVFEIRPNIKWDKGKAVKWLIKSLGKEDALPVYIGDDRTDEDAFQALKNKGVGILVSRKRRESQADYFLKNVDEVKKFLSVLISLSR